MHMYAPQPCFRPRHSKTRREGHLRRPQEIMAFTLYCCTGKERSCASRAVKLIISQRYPDDYK